MNCCRVCNFCLSNGESEAQYRSHKLKNKSGLVTCPVLRSFTCYICKATGDFAHTQRYCPLNKDGKFNTGASLTDLKKKKNAAGNFPSVRKSHNTNNKSNDEFAAVWKAQPISTSTKSPFYPPMATDPLPSYCRPLGPPPQSSQFALNRHLQYLKYYEQKQLHHQAEITRIQAIRRKNAITPSGFNNYYRNFSGSSSVSPGSWSPPDYSVFPEVGGKVGDVVGRGVKVVQKVERDLIGNMLAELRMGTEELGV